MIDTDYINTDDPYWEWEEAFDKYGFCDGDGVVQTWRVADALEKAGYLVQVTPRGMHNTGITSILSGDMELMPIGEGGGKSAMMIQGSTFQTPSLD